MRPWRVRRSLSVLLFCFRWPFAKLSSRSNFESMNSLSGWTFLRIERLDSSQMNRQLDSIKVVKSTKSSVLYCLFQSDPGLALTQFLFLSRILHWHLETILHFYTLCCLHSLQPLSRSTYPFHVWHYFAHILDQIWNLEIPSHFKKTWDRLQNANQSARATCMGYLESLTQFSRPCWTRSIFGRFLRSLLLNCERSSWHTKHCQYLLLNLVKFYFNWNNQSDHILIFFHLCLFSGNYQTATWQLYYCSISCYRKIREIGRRGTCRNSLRTSFIPNFLDCRFKSDRTEYC